MISTDEEVRVSVVRLPQAVKPPRVVGYWLTPEGEAALDAAELAHERAVAAEARELARQRRNRHIAGDPQALVLGWRQRRGRGGPDRSGPVRGRGSDSAVHRHRQQQGGLLAVDQQHAKRIVGNLHRAYAATRDPRQVGLPAPLGR
jgi:hypothetical protein